LRYALRDTDCSGKWTRDDAAKWWQSAGKDALQPVEA